MKNKLPHIAVATTYFSTKAIVLGFYFLLLATTSLLAQDGTNVAGREASGPEGSVSFTIGQIDGFTALIQENKEIAKIDVKKDESSDASKEALLNKNKELAKKILAIEQKYQERLDLLLNAAFRELKQLQNKETTVVADKKDGNADSGNEVRVLGNKELAKTDDVSEQKDFLIPNNIHLLD